MSAPNPFVPLPPLTGERLLLRPLEESDLEALYTAASDPLIWAQHPDPLRWQRDSFETRFFQGALSCGSAFVVEDLVTGRIIGSSRFYDWNADTREVAIGYTFLQCQYWGRGYNAEMKHLMLIHAFAWAKRVWFHIGADNIRSRKAIEKIGGKLDSVREDPVNGTAIPYAWYVIE